MQVAAFGGRSEIEAPTLGLQGYLRQANIVSYNKQCLCVLLVRYHEKIEGTDHRVTSGIYRHSRVTGDFVGIITRPANAGDGTSSAKAPVSSHG